MMSDYSAVIFGACLLCGAIIAVRQLTGVAAITMLVSAVVLFALTCWAWLLFDFQISFGRAAEWFPFTPVTRVSEILFGLSFILFLVQKPKTIATRDI